MLSEKVINNKVYNTGTDDVKLFVYMHLTEIKFDFVHQMYVCLCVCVCMCVQLLYRVYVCRTWGHIQGTEVLTEGFLA